MLCNRLQYFERQVLNLAFLLALFALLLVVFLLCFGFLAALTG